MWCNSFLHSSRPSKRLEITSSLFEPPKFEILGNGKALFWRLTKKKSCTSSRYQQPRILRCLVVLFLSFSRFIILYPSLSLEFLFLKMPFNYFYCFLCIVLQFCKLNFSAPLSKSCYFIHPPLKTFQDKNAISKQQQKSFKNKTVTTLTYFMHNFFQSTLIGRYKL